MIRRNFKEQFAAKLPAGVIASRFQKALLNLYTAICL